MFCPAYELIPSRRNYEFSRRNLRNKPILDYCAESICSIWIADAHRRDGTRFVVRAEVKADDVFELTLMPL